MVEPLVNIAEVRMGYSFRSRLEFDADGDVAVIQMKDIDESNLLHPENLSHIHMPELKDRHMVQQGDLMFRSRGGSNFVSLIAADLGRAVLAAPMMLIRPKTKLIDSAYLQWFINKPTTQNLLSSQAEGTSVKMISKATIEQLPVDIPSLSCQRQIIQISLLAFQETELMNKIMNKRKALIETILTLKANALSQQI